METGVIQIELKDGRVFRILYLNSTQKQKIVRSYYDMEKQVKNVTVVTNGLHTTKQWLEMAETL